MPTAWLTDEEIAPAPQPPPTTRKLRPRVTAAILAAGAAAGIAVGVVAGVVITPKVADPVKPQPSAAPTVIAVPKPKVVPVPVPQNGPVPGMRNVIPPIPTVEAVEMGAIRQQNRIVSRDNGQSTRYGHLSVWVFADTLLRGPHGFLSNTGAATTDLRASDGISLTAADLLGNQGTSPAEFLPRTEAEQKFEAERAKGAQCAEGFEGYCSVTFGFWPGPVIADPARHRVLIFYDKLCRGGKDGAACSGRFGMDQGTGIAALDMDTRQLSRLRVTGTPTVRSIEGDDPTMFFPAATKYASAAVVAGEYVYVYGDCETRCRLSRAPLANLTDRTQWRFYAGRTATSAPLWSADPADALYTVRAGAAGNTVLWSPALRGWLNIYMPFGSSTLRAQIGGSPFGPWSQPFSLLRTAGAGTNYASFGHAEYAERGGLVQYMSYYQASTGAQRLVKVTFGR